MSSHRFNAITTPPSIVGNLDAGSPDATVVATADAAADATADATSLPTLMVASPYEDVRELCIRIPMGDVNRRLVINREWLYTMLAATFMQISSIAMTAPERRPSSRHHYVDVQVSNCTHDVQRVLPSELEQMPLANPGANVPSEVENESSSTCAICMEGDASAKPLVRTPCAHVFHKACLAKWLLDEDKRSCPVCRTECFRTDRTSERMVGVRIRYAVGTESSMASHELYTLITNYIVDVVDRSNSRSRDRDCDRRRNSGDDDRNARLDDEVLQLSRHPSPTPTSPRHPPPADHDHEDPLSPESEYTRPRRRARRY